MIPRSLAPISSGRGKRSPGTLASMAFAYTISVTRTRASVRAVALGLPIIGKLLGHTQASTTARYAHLDNDPLRRASENIGGRIAAAWRAKRAAR